MLNSAGILIDCGSLNGLSKFLTKFNYKDSICLISCIIFMELAIYCIQHINTIL